MFVLRGLDAGGGNGGDPNKWRLTPLGKILLAFLALAFLLGLLAQFRPDGDNRSHQPATPPAVQPSGTQRIFTTTDATDFTQLTYASYAAIMANELKLTPQSAEPPYDLNHLLERLELMRPKLSDSLYRRIQESYKRSATVGTISRDEIVCGRPDAQGYKAYLKLGGREVAVVTVNAIRDNKLAEAFEVTVDLNGKVLSDITCRQ
jgi:hypothetical protein